MSKKTKAEHRMDLVASYVKASSASPFSTQDVARWALKMHLAEPKRVSPIKLLAREIADAMRATYTTDPQGRRIRALHCFFDEERQQMLWVDSNAGTFKQVRNGFQYRRKQILSDCWQLSTDVDSYNENYAARYGQPIQVTFNFEADIAEKKQPTEYVGDLEATGAPI